MLIKENAVIAHRYKKVEALDLREQSQQLPHLSRLSFCYHLHGKAMAGAKQLSLLIFAKQRNSHFVPTHCSQVIVD